MRCVSSNIPRAANTVYASQVLETNMSNHKTQSSKLIDDNKVKASPKVIPNKIMT